MKRTIQAGAAAKWREEDHRKSYDHAYHSNAVKWGGFSGYSGLSGLSGIS
jgi:hypothetical protein